MATNPPPYYQAGSTNTASSLGYVDDFLSIFDRPQKTHVFKRPDPEKTISTENLLRKPPLVRATALQPSGDPWNSGFLRRIPYSGALALLTVILCAVADGIVLCKSDGQEVDTWIVSPSVLLAVFSAMANVCLEYAHGQGVVVAWWRKALRGGTLNDLHRNWEFGDSILAAGTSGRKFNFVAFATLMASTVVLDGPLLQKASTIVSIEVTKPVNVTALVAEEVPYGYTGFGTFGDGSSDDILMGSSFSEIVNQYATRSPITTNFTGCVGTCSGTVKAAGLAVNCSEHSRPWSSSEGAPVNGSDVFSSNFQWIPAQSTGIQSYTDGINPFPDSPFIDFQLEYATGRTAGVGIGGGAAESPISDPGARIGCNGTILVKRCSMRSATLDYPFSMANNTISLLRGSSDFPVDHIQAVGEPSDFFEQHDLNPASFITLGGVAKVAQNIFSSTAHQSTGGIFITMEGSLADQYVDYGTGNSSFYKTQDACAINWSDPTSDIVDAMNEIMFRTALSAANVSKFSIMNSSIFDSWTTYYEMFPVNYTTLESGIPIPQTILMVQTSQITVFQSHYEFLAGALGVMMLGVLVVIPLFHSFWAFGRKVSLNPLEIAKAFNAELLREQGSNSTLKHLTKNFGEKEVKYGEIIDATERSSFDTLGVGGRKLELADPSRVREPRFQAVYI